MEIKSIYVNSLIFDEMDNNQNFYSESDLYKDQPQQNSFNNRYEVDQQIQPHQNVYSNGENFTMQCDKKKEKGKVLHLLKNFTQEMKQRWNMSDIEIRIHNYLDENQVYITDPMQKQMDYYQKIKNQIISSVVLNNQQYSSDEDEVMKEMSAQKKEMDIEEMGNGLDLAISTRYNNNGDETPFDENEEERDHPVNMMESRGKYQSTMTHLDSISTTSSLNSQLSLQQSSIFVKRRMSKSNSLVLQAPQSLSQQNSYEQFYYN